MKIIKKDSFKISLQNTIAFIKKDKVTPIKKFKQEIDNYIELLKTNPKMGKMSQKLENQNYRELIYKGYTITYKIDSEIIYILDIYKWQNK